MVIVKKKKKSLALLTCATYHIRKVHFFSNVSWRPNTLDVTELHLLNRNERPKDTRILCLKINRRFFFCEKKNLFSVKQKLNSRTLYISRLKVRRPWEEWNRSCTEKSSLIEALSWLCNSNLKGFATFIIKGKVRSPTLESENEEVHLQELVYSNLS